MGLSRAANELLYVIRSIWNESSNRHERGRRILRLLGWQVWKRTVRAPLVVALFNGMKFRAYPDCDVSSGALYYRVPDGKDILFLRSQLNGGTFVDVGANVGLVSLLVADKVQHAILFEPNPLAADRARENLKMNDLDYQVYGQALSDAVGSVEFEDAGAVSSCNRTVDGFKTSVPTITVPRTTFDQFLLERVPLPAKVSAVKIDVEGHENSVLRGMQEFLRVQRPRIVMFEYLQRTNIKITIELFAEVGYEVLELSPSGPQRATDRVAP